MNVTEAMQFLEGFARLGAADTGAGVVVPLLTAAVVNTLRPSATEDETIGIGGWHRAGGWQATANELASATLSVLLLLRIAGAAGDAHPCAQLLHPSLLLHALTTTLYLLPKLPTAEFLYDFLLCTTLWAAAACAAVAPLSLDVHTVLTLYLPLAFVALFPIKSILLGEITFMRYDIPRITLQASFFHLGIVTPYMLALKYDASAPADLPLRAPPQLLISALNALGLPSAAEEAALQHFALVAYYPVAILASLVTRKVWDSIFHVVAMRKRRMMEAADDIPGVTSPDVGTSQKKKKRK